MSAIQGPSLKTIRIVNWVFPLLSVCITLVRLYDRTRRRKLWWDDAWAFMGMIFAIIIMVSSELHIINPPSFSQHVKIAIYYMYFADCILLAILYVTHPTEHYRCDQFYYAVTLSVRLSILFTVIRLCPNGLMRTTLGYFSVLFIIAWVILFAQVWWVCESEPGWKTQSMPQCFLGEDVAIGQVVTAVVTDVILIFSPVKLLWRVRLSRAEKIRLMSIFATTAIFTAVSLYHSWAVLRVGSTTEVLAAVLEFSIGLIVANLSVIVAWYFRLTNDDGGNNRQPLHLHSHIRFKQRTNNTLSTDIGTLSTNPQEEFTVDIDTHITSDSSDNDKNTNKTIKGWNDSSSYELGMLKQKRSASTMGQNFDAIDNNPQDE